VRDRAPRRAGEARLALRQLLGDTDRQLAEAFHAGASASELVHTRAQAVERIVVHAWSACVGESNELALFAAGGFGRGELFPHSDVDLLALSEHPPSAPMTPDMDDDALPPDEATRTFTRLRPRLQGIAYRMLGTLAEAEEVVQDAWLRWHEVGHDEADNAEAWMGLAASYDELGRFDFADRAYDQLLKVAGRKPQIVNNMGYSQLLRGNKKKARALLMEARAGMADPTVVNANLALLNKG